MIGSRFLKSTCEAQQTDMWILDAYIQTNAIISRPNVREKRAAKIRGLRDRKEHISKEIKTP